MYMASDTFGIWQTVGLDWRVLAVSATLAFGTALLFGLFPAFHASRVDVHAALIESGTRGVAGTASRWPRRFLVAGEVAMGVVLLTGAGLMIRTLAHLRGLNPGFDPRNVITARLSLQDARYRTPESVNRLFDQTLSRIKELPGVESAAVVLGLPYERVLNTGFRFPGESRSRITNLCYATPEFFQTMRIPVLRGRVFSSADRADTQSVLVVNDEWVRTYLKGKDPIGAHVIQGREESVIIGVVSSVLQRPGWGNSGPLAPTPEMYMPATQAGAGFFALVHTWFSPSWVVRTSGPVTGAIGGIQRAVEAVDPLLPIAGFKSMNEVQSSSVSYQRFLVILLGGLAALAVILAAVGIYGLVANSVAERTRELGIRMALGASAGQAIKTIMLPGVFLALVGAVIGAGLARAAVQLLRTLLWGVSVTDPATFVAAGAGLVLVAGLAGVIPALRIMRMDPGETLRHE
jgi:predicted permease